MLDGLPFPLGAYEVEGGINVAVFSEHATPIELCLFDEHARELFDLVSLGTPVTVLP